MRHLIKYHDGSVAIMNTISDDVKPSDEIMKWSEEHRNSVHSHRPLNDDELPSDRNNRNLWRHENDKIIVKEE